MSRSRPPFLLILVAVAMLAGFAGWCTYYYPFFSDDAFISLRYAERLVEGHGLTWSDGDRVEGYSDLLWVLLLALVQAVAITVASGLLVMGVEPVEEM